MKKSLFFAAAAVAVLASCSQDEKGLDLNIANENKAIEFSAYTSTMVTRAASISDTVTTPAKFLAKGIGVFAFYQPAVNGREGAAYTSAKYATPNFMYNQNVKYNSGNDTWYYSPAKYWPNNENDKLTFFAYAPYESTKTWEDLGIETDATGKHLSMTFAINNLVKDQIDFLFAEPQLNMLKPSTDPTTYSENADSIGAVKDSTGVVGGATPSYGNNADIITFNFKHVLSKVNLFVGVALDDTTHANGINGKTGPEAWFDKNTKIAIKSIEFKDLADTYTWNREYTAGESRETAKGTWTATGKQDITVIPDEKDEADTIQTSASWSTAKWHRVLGCNDVAKPDTTTAADQYMFIAPQTLNSQEIVITYVVETTDEANKDNCSTITNVITKKWSDLVSGSSDFVLKAEKQYRIYFLIGMQSVKIGATIQDWTDGDPAQSEIEVPAVF